MRLFETHDYCGASGVEEEPGKPALIGEASISKKENFVIIVDLTGIDITHMYEDEKFPGDDWVRGTYFKELDHYETAKLIAEFLEANLAKEDVGGVPLLDWLGFRNL